MAVNKNRIADTGDNKGSIGTERNPHLRWRLLSALVTACFATPAAFNSALANPMGASVASGVAGFNNQGSTLIVTNSPGAVINWQSFSIGAGETTRFAQQSAASSVLNRVIGADPSVILGTLSSNGRVFLINQSGILMGAGAKIDTAGFVASTLNLSNEDFAAGRLNFVNLSAPVVGTLTGEARPQG
ncbi:MAG TPA: filamentous hemagglutinin N-terminal domain-containing protein [Burkholderiales bacterium]|nr:filamentous hemagglutinin N-terminal domain-containing protein [Burkholderiales bacterium]